MSISLDTWTYVDDLPRSPDWFRYTGPSHTLSFKDYVDLKRTAPKPTATSDGKAKGSFKLTKGVTDGTDYLDDVILEITTSIPVGADGTEVDNILSKTAAFLASAEAKALFKNQNLLP